MSNGVYAVGYVMIPASNIYEYHYGLVDDVMESMKSFRQLIKNHYIDKIHVKKLDKERMIEYIVLNKKKLSDRDVVKFIEL